MLNAMSTPGQLTVRTQAAVRGQSSGGIGNWSEWAVRIHTDNQLLDLIDEIRVAGMGSLGAAVITLAGSGLRSGELLGLEVSDAGPLTYRQWRPLWKAAAESAEVKATAHLHHGRRSQSPQGLCKD
jgi:hypothetical protein